MTSLHENCCLFTLHLHKGAVMWSIDVFFAASRSNTAGRAFLQSTLSDLSINLLRSDKHFKGSHAVDFRHSLSMNRYFPAWRIKLECQSGKVNIVINKKKMIRIDAKMAKNCFTVEVPRDFGKSCRSYWMASGGHRKVIWNNDSPRKLGGDVLNFDARTTCWWPGTVRWQCHDIYFVIQKALLPVYMIHQWLTGWLAVEKGAKPLPIQISLRRYFQLNVMYNHRWNWVLNTVVT